MTGEQLTLQQIRDTYYALFRYILELTQSFHSRCVPIAVKLAIIITLLLSSGMILLGIAIVNDQNNLMQNTIVPASQILTILYPVLLNLHILHPLFQD